MKVYFSPISEECKSPVGAVKENTPCAFRLYLFDCDCPAELVLRKDGGAPVRYAMAERKSGEGKEYSVTLSLPFGLYFYYFDACGRIGRGEDYFACEGGEDYVLAVYRSAMPLGGCGITYQIMTDRFCIGGERLRTRSDAVYRDDWGGAPSYLPVDGKILNNDFFGGNFRGIREKLGYLKSLGVTTIYLNPVFEAYSNHKYDTGDYTKTDADFGGDAEFFALCDEADKLGIGIILDGVFSHTGSDSVYFNRYGKYGSVGAYNSQSSPYYEWYRFDRFPDLYDCWWGFDTLPATNETSSFKQFICGACGVVERWSGRLGGWRLDVADELPDEFLDEFYAAVKRINPSAVIIAEVWEDAVTKISYGARRRFLLGGQADSVMNYPLRRGIIDFILLRDGSRLAAVAYEQINNYPPPVLNRLLNSLTTHDTARIITALGDEPPPEDKRLWANATLKDYRKAALLARFAAVLQYTFYGTPCLFYGDEAGLQGYEGLLCRRCYPWGDEDRELLDFYARLGKIRIDNGDVYAEGKFILLRADSVFAFERRVGERGIITVVNLSEADFVYPASGVELLTDEPYTGCIKPMSAAIIKRQ